MPFKLMRWPVWLAALAGAVSVTGCVHVEKPPPVHIEKPPPFHIEKPPPVHPTPIHIPSPETTMFNDVVDKSAAVATGVAQGTPAQVRQGCFLQPASCSRTRRRRAASRLFKMSRPH